MWTGKRTQIYSETFKSGMRYMVKVACVFMGIQNLLRKIKQAMGNKITTTHTFLWYKIDV